jgi:hypothetical protein
MFNKRPGELTKGGRPMKNRLPRETGFLPGLRDLGFSKTRSLPKWQSHPGKLCQICASATNGKDMAAIENQGFTVKP